MKELKQDIKIPFMAEKIGYIDDDVLNALAEIRDGNSNPKLRLTLETLAGTNLNRQNFIDAELELERSDYGSSHSHKMTPTQNGTGLSREAKTPTDLRLSE